jgi:hypothetical protein
MLFKDKAFSILVDESTNTTCNKLLAVLVHHVGPNSAVVDDFLGIKEVVSTTGEELLIAIQGNKLFYREH